MTVFYRANLDENPEVVRLVSERAAAKQSGDFQRADELRLELARHGARVDDLKDGNFTVKELRK